MQNSTFAFDNASFEVEINVSTDPNKEKIVAARMRRSTLEEEIAREKKATIEYREVSSSEEEIVVLEEVANAELFDSIVTDLLGFRLKGDTPGSAKEWREATPEILALIPSSWKSAFIRGSRICSTKFVETDEDDGVVLGGDSTLGVELIVGYEDNPQGVVTFEIPEPAESERIEFVDKATQFRQSRGRKRSAKVVTDLRACVRFFDELMKRPGASINGATFQGKTYAQCSEPLSKLAYLDSIHPSFKQRVINTALAKYNARLQD